MSKQHISYVPHVPSTESSSRTYSRLSALVSIGMVLGVGFDLTRPFGSDWLRPTFILVFPCVVLLWLRHPSLAFSSTKSWAARLMLGMCLLALLGHVAGTDVFSYWSGTVAMYEPTAIAGMYICFVAGMCIGKQERLTRVASGSLLLVVAVHSAAVLFSQNSIRHQGTIRSTGLHDDPNIVLAYILLPLCFAIPWARLRRHYLLLLIVSILAVGATLSTVSKMGLVALVVMGVSAAGVILTERTRRWRGLQHVVVLTMIIVLAGIFVWTLFPEYVSEVADSYSKRIEAAQRRASASVLEERLRWVDVIKLQDWMSLERLYGSGYSADNLPHNSFLDMYFSTGIPGLVAMLLLVGSALWGNANAFRGFSSSREMRKATGSAVLGIVVLSIIISALSICTLKLCWFLVGLAHGVLVRANSCRCVTTGRCISVSLSRDHSPTKLVYTGMTAYLRSPEKGRL